MRRFSVLAAVLPLGLLLTSPAHAASAPAASAPTSYTVTHDVRVTMSDGVSLDSDEYVPTAGCPCPVILIQTPYRKDGSVAEANPYFPAHGYAEIVVDVRGTGSSEGIWTSFGEREQQDGAELVRYSTGRPFSNGVIGLAGVSYGAINQLLTVEQPGTSAVKAIFPIVPMSDAYRDVTWAGGNEDSGFIPFWLGLVTSLNMFPADDAASQPAIALNAESQHAYGVTQFQAPTAASSSMGYYESSLPKQAQMYPDASYDGPFSYVRSPLYRIASVHQPAFIVGGLYDIFQRGEPLLYEGLPLPSSQKKLLIGPWYHTTAGNGLPARDAAGNTIPNLNTLQLAWFDHWLKGIGNGIQNFSDETYFLGAGQFEPGPYPWGRTPQSWYLGSGSLSTSKPATPGSTVLPWTAGNGVCSRDTTQWTAGLAHVANCENDQRPTEALGVTFTGPAATVPYTLSGPLDLHAYIRSQRADGSLIATLSDVAPDGSSNPVTGGSLLLSLRALSSAACGAVVVNCTQYANGKPIIPWHPYTRGSQSPLEPGKTYAVDVEIFPTSLVLEPGHRLRLTLTSSDAPHEAATASSTADSAGNPITILYGGPYASYLYLDRV